MSDAPQELVYAEDPIWINRVWLDTIIVAGLTCFILCLMGLSKVRTILLRCIRLSTRGYRREAATQFSSSLFLLVCIYPLPRSPRPRWG